MVRVRLIAWLMTAWLSLVVFPSALAPGLEWPPRDGLRVLFLGDSITQAGVYVRDIEGYLATRFPDRHLEIINLGLSSETLSGTTEPGHPFPRPDVRTRLARALELAKPNLVFVCYGMNDGIYAPPDPGRIERYRKGIDEVVAAIHRAGADVIVGTPPPFDPRPILAKTTTIQMKGPGYGAPYVDYDGVLGIFASQLLARRAAGWVVADIHAVSLGALTALRAADPEYTLARDGVHPAGDGHWLIARAYLEAWGATAEVDSATIDARNRQVLAGQVELDPATAADPSLRLRWTTKIPLPRDPSWDPRLVALERIDERFNRHRLLVVGLPAARYALFEGDKLVGEATREELAAGLDLLRFPKLSTNRRAAEVWDLIARRHKIMNPSWLEAVGHGPPKFPAAAPLEEAQSRAAAVEAQIRDLARPVAVPLRLAPISD